MPDKIVKHFLETQYELHRKMVETEHGYMGVFPNPYHLEGSVWTHTMMVVNEAKNDNAPDWMIEAALLHDIGKTKTVLDQDNQRRSFRNHEAVSMFMANDILTGDTRPQTLLVIAQHGSFYNYFEDGKVSPENAAKMRSKFGYQSLKNLLTFYKYDHNGRIHTNDFDVEFDIDEIVDGSYPTMPDTANEIVVMIGLPRSGKDTYVNKIFGDYTVISRDDIVMEYPGESYGEKWENLTPENQKDIDVELQKRFNDATAAKKDIVVNLTNMSKKTRRKWLNFKGHNTYLKRAVVIPTSIDVCASRNNEFKNIPYNVIENFAKRFSFPDFEEFDEISIV